MRAELISQLVGNTSKTIFSWKKEDRLIIQLLEKYFNDLDIEEFLGSGQVSRLEEYTTKSEIFKSFNYTLYVYFKNYDNDLLTFFFNFILVNYTSFDFRSNNSVEFNNYLYSQYLISNPLPNSYSPSFESSVRKVLNDKHLFFYLLIEFKNTFQDLNVYENHDDIKNLSIKINSFFELVYQLVFQLQLENQDEYKKILNYNLVF